MEIIFSKASLLFLHLLDEAPGLFFNWVDSYPQIFKGILYIENTMITNQNFFLILLFRNCFDFNVCFHVSTFSS